MRRARVMLCLGAVLAIVLSLDRPSARERSRGAPATAAAKTAVELVPSRRSELDRLEIEMPDPRETRAPRRAISDLVVELSPGRVDLEQALAGGSGSGIAAERHLFRARVLVVSGGRLYRGAPAWCGGFERDLSTCAVDCEGGRFGLKMRSGPRGSMIVIVGELPGNRDTGDRPGFAINGCAFDTASELRMVPKQGAAAAEIVLTSELAAD